MQANGRDAQYVSCACSNRKTGSEARHGNAALKAAGWSKARSGSSKISGWVGVCVCAIPTRRGVQALVAIFGFSYPTRPFGHVRLSIMTNEKIPNKACIITKTNFFDTT